MCPLMVVRSVLWMIPLLLGLPEWVQDRLYGTGRIYWV